MNFQRIRGIGIAHAIVYGVIVCGAAALMLRTAAAGKPVVEPGFFLLDGLSVFFMFVISIVGFAAALYSAGYISHDVQEGRVSERKALLYYALFDLFLASMFLVVSVNSLGILWAAVEMTTLVSAFLVGFYRTKQSIEAAWKYIIVCSVGIILALLGTIFFSYAMSCAGGPRTLNWTDLHAYAALLDKNIVRIAFIFILVGYGTKAGIAPMHTWLPDAHSQAVAPASALLSAVLLPTALYAIMRFGLIVNISLGSVDYFSRLLTAFGLASLGIAAGLLLVQKDLKRLLAYSSIEHIGVICTGLGIGGPVAVFGVLLHILNHAAVKSLLFFGAGAIVSRYGTHNMRLIRGVGRSMPFTGVLCAAAACALIGFPPFSIFMSELLIVISGFSKGAYALTAALLFFLAVAFGAVIFHIWRMLSGRMPKGLQQADEPLSIQAAYVFLFIFILGLGIWVPGIIRDGITAAAQVLTGI
ncbi:MAG: hydrogenase 4 subunit F [Candidatus Omnitrophica bacterium]|nr:hydrogenase 4 subunit F [Candidatus Omnitrophota bacterium]